MWRKLRTKMAHAVIVGTVAASPLAWGKTSDPFSSCAEALFERNQLLERVAKALRRRLPMRVHKTLVSEIGASGNRTFLVAFGRNDLHLDGIPPEWRPAFDSLAVGLSGLERNTNPANVVEVFRDAHGPIVRIETEDSREFPTFATSLVEELKLMDSLARRDVEVFWRVRQPLLPPEGATRVYGGIKVSMRIRLLRAPRGFEYAEAVIAKAWLRHRNQWVLIASGTDR